MNRRTLLALMTVMALGLISQTTAEAGGGGGGSKKNATIKVVNTQPAGNADQYVLALPAGKPVPANAAAFQAAGGKAVSPGQTVTLPPTPAGAGQIIVTNAAAVGTVTTPYNVSGGKTYTYLIGGVDGAPTIQKQ